MLNAEASALVTILDSIFSLHSVLRALRARSYTRNERRCSRSRGVVSSHFSRRRTRGYMVRLLDECKHPQVDIVMQKEGHPAGGYAFPFCHVAVLSNINHSQIERETWDQHHAAIASSTSWIRRGSTRP